jgi:hypothetical protein
MWNSRAQLLASQTHGSISGLPVGGANITVLIGELESLKEAEGLINRAANRGLVENHVANDAIGANQERGTIVTYRSQLLPGF